ncbi:MAG: pirin family protein [Sneathiella sp.]
MAKHQIRIIHRDDIPLGGFAGIVETRMVMSPSLWPGAKDNKEISHGLDDFLYLATGHFKPKEGAPLHPHKDVDIVSFIPGGAIGHTGTMGHGTTIHGPGVQVQRAGTGIEHSEFNLNDTPTDLVQMWFSPPAKGLDPDYRDYTLQEDGMITVLGEDNTDAFESSMRCQIGILKPAQTVTSDIPFIAFLQQGTALANGQSVKAGDVIEGGILEFNPIDTCTLVLIQSNRTI